MKGLPTNQYVKIRNSGYYVAGTQIGLDVLIYDFQNGRSAEAIFEAYPSIGSLAKVYCAITFILEHPAKIETYLRDEDHRFDEVKEQHPLPPELFERGRKELSSKRG